MSRLPIVRESINKLFKTVDPSIPIEILINKSDIDTCVNKNSLQAYLELDYLDSKYQWNLNNSIAFSEYGIKESLKNILINKK